MINWGGRNEGNFRERVGRHLQSPWLIRRPRNFLRASKLGKGEGDYYTHLEKQSSLSEGDAGRRLVPSIQREYADLCSLTGFTPCADRDGDYRDN